MKYTFLIAFLALSLSAFAQYPLVSIHDIQYKSDAALGAEDDLSDYEGDTVTIHGLVIFDPCTYALSTSGTRMGTFLSDVADDTQWSGITVLIDSAAIVFDGSLEDLNDATLFVDNFQVGNIVECVGIVSTFDGLTQFLILPEETSVIGFGTPPAPYPATIGQFMQSDGAGGQVIQTVTGEPYENVYVEFNNVFVTDVTYNAASMRWTWFLQDLDGNKIQIRDISGYYRNDISTDDECNIWAGGAAGEVATPDEFIAPPLGTYLSYVRGAIVEFSVSTQYAIAPLVPDDLGPALAVPPVITNITRNPVVATPDENVTISATITDLDGIVVSASVNYSYGIGNAGFITVPMSNVAGDTWEGDIPGPGTDSTYVNYYITATDDFGNTINYPSPVSPNIYIVYEDGINSIVQIQNTPFTSGNSVWANDSIPSMSIEAYVTSTTQTYDLGLVAVQEGSGPYEGIFIKSVPGDGTEQLYRGDKILITAGKVIEEFNVTKFSNITYTLESQMNPLPAFVTGLDPVDVDAKVYDETEPYEGMLVKFDDAFVTSNNADAAAGGAFGEWRVNTANTPEIGMRCDDYSYEIDYDFGPDTLTMGESLTYIQGLMYYSFGNWKLLPRDKNDIEGYTTTYPNSIVSFNFTSPLAAGSINEAAHTITVVVPEGTDVTSLVPAIDYTGEFVDPASGVAQDFSIPVVYTSIAPVTYSEKEYTVTVTFDGAIESIGIMSNIQVYPNPSNDVLTVEIQASEPGDISACLKDLTGRNIQQFNTLCNVGKNIFAIDLKGFANGVYLLQLSNSSESTIRKIEVSR